MKNLFTLLALILSVILLSFSMDSKKIVVIDVGHGGKDSGVVIKNRALEKDVALKIAYKIQQLNDNPNIEIKLTREDDEFLTIEERVALINKIKPDYVISIHANYAGDKTTKGAEFYYNDENSFAKESAGLTKKLRASFEDKMTVNKISNANFLILRNSECPATMIECGFLSNDEDYALLTSEEGQEMIAKNILTGLK